MSVGAIIITGTKEEEQDVVHESENLAWLLEKGVCVCVLFHSYKGCLFCFSNWNF